MENDGTVVCPLCNGTGFVSRIPDYQDRSDEEPCPMCANKQNENEEN